MKHIPTEFALNVHPSISSTAIYASPILRDAFNTQERIALNVATTMPSKMESASTGSQQVWLFSEEMTGMTLKSILSMSDSQNTTSATFPQLQP